MVNENDRFKFVDDLTTLEIVDLLSVGLTSYNFKQHVASDIPTNSYFIPPNNLISQKQINDIDSWTEKQKMLLNSEKTKNMIFNFTNDYQFTTRMGLHNKNIEVLDSTKLLGTIISNDLKWDLNSKEIVRKGNSRMQLLRKVASFGASEEELKIVYFSYVRSQLQHLSSV